MRKHFQLVFDEMKTSVFLTDWGAELENKIKKEMLWRQESEETEVVPQNEASLSCASEIVWYMDMEMMLGPARS